MATFDRIPTKRRKAVSRRVQTAKLPFRVYLSDISVSSDTTLVSFIDTCDEALWVAHNWAWPDNERASSRFAEVWCGMWQVYEADSFNSLTLEHPSDLPMAPGTYRCEVNEETNEVRYFLVRAGTR
jgi:hypothetical protein